MLKTRLHAGLIVIEPGSGATEGVLDKGVSGQSDYVHRSDTPLSRTPSEAPEPGFNDDESGVQSCLRHCKAGSFSEYSKVIIEHVDRVRFCKMIFIYHRRENDISQMYSADNFLDSATCHQGQVAI